MRFRSMETTPNPNSMKLNFDEQFGAAKTYSAADESAACPAFVKELLKLEQLQSIFVCQDFITLNKDPRADWEHLLNEATRILLGGAENTKVMASAVSPVKSEGQAQVLVQTFRSIPIQIKVVDSQGESRMALSARFNEAAQLIQQKTGADFLKERHWVDRGLRYGSRDEIAREMAEEIEGGFDESMLERVKSSAVGESLAQLVPIEILREWLEDKNWQKRIAAINELSLSADSTEVFDLLLCALKDDHPQVRRLAAATLGATANLLAVPPLCEAFENDQSVAVRRTAGDALSDIASPVAEQSACRALADPNRLVRWRAARILSDMGTEVALPFLKQAACDEAFEVKLEVESAIKRITTGASGLGSVWRRISEQQQ
ncbi:MAG: virulence factor [Candidatus Obscuribacterales bacterium]|nr:virulence factor [Candidatus Obscuribacterales bacterium]